MGENLQLLPGRDDTEFCPFVCEAEVNTRTMDVRVEKTNDYLTDWVLLEIETREDEQGVLRGLGLATTFCPKRGVDY